MRSVQMYHVVYLIFITIFEEKNIGCARTLLLHFRNSKYYIE